MMTREATDRLLLYCARHHLDAEAVASARDLLNEGLDWSRLLAIAGRHNLLPLLRYRLLALDIEGIPAAVRSHLQYAYYSTLVHNEKLQSRLKDVVESLREEGVEVIVLKGGALAGTVYDKPALRPMCDLDLLMRREDMRRARPALERLGYQLSTAIPDQPSDFPWRYGGEVEFVLPEKGQPTVLDIHWHIVTVGWYRHASAIDMEAMWSRARPLVVEGVTTWQLSPEDTLIHLCLHVAIQHGYDCLLVQYADMDWLLNRYDLVWGSLVERASSFKVKTPVYWGLLLAQQWLGTGIPPSVLVALQPPGYRRRIVQGFMPHDPLLSADGATVARNRLLRVSLIDGPGDVIRMVQHTLFPQREWLVARYALGNGATVFFYRLLHPLWVVRALVLALLRNVQPLGIFYVRQPKAR